MGDFTESVVEQAALAWLESLGYATISGPTIAPDEPRAERASFDEVVLTDRLRAALARLNPGVSSEALEEAFRRVVRVDAADAVSRNRAFHKMLVDGVTVEEKRKDGSIGGVIVRLIDFDEPDNNDWLVVNQFTVTSGASGHNRRPDIVVFVNGLPLAVLELKNAADEQATIWDAFNQLQTYKAQIPRLFAYNEALVISDGLEARIGSLTAARGTPPLATGYLRDEVPKSHARGRESNPARARSSFCRSAIVSSYSAPSAQATTATGAGVFSVVARTRLRIMYRPECSSTLHIRTIHLRYQPAAVATPRSLSMRNTWHVRSSVP